MLDELAVQIRQINAKNGWTLPTIDDFYYDTGNEDAIPARLALVHSEVSEALEAYRHNDLENFSEEMADIIIRVLDLAAGLGLSMDSEVAAKMEKNRKRSYRHGGKRV